MANLLMGKAVADALSEKLKNEVEVLKKRGVTPALAILRVGENAGDLSYEKGARKRAKQLCVSIRRMVFPGDVSAETLLEAIDQRNKDASVHGVWLYRPLPEHLKARETEICNRLIAEKDVDGMTDLSAAGI